MAQEIINVGAAPNDGLGDPIRTSFQKCNNNFNELYSRVQSSPPVTLTGSVGDTAGMVAYDENYFYYCFADFDGSSIIWNEVPNAGNAQVTALTASANITGAYIFGDGSGLTNVSAGAPTSVVNGNSNVIVASNGNISFSATGKANILTITNLAAASPSHGLIVDGQILASGNVFASNVAATSNILAGNLISTGLLTATGNISGANLSLTGNVTSALNLSGNLTVAGNASILGSVVGNANVTGNISGGNITATGQLTTTGNITSSGGFFIGDGGFLSNVTVASNVAVTQVANGTTSFSVLSSGGNLSATVGGTANILVLDSTGANITGKLTATGNIEGGNLITGGIVVSAGNITGGNLRTGGSILAVTSITGGTLISTGNANVTGNVHGSNVIASANAIATGNVIGGNITTAGQVIATGNITGGNLITTGLLSTANITVTNTITANSFVSNNGVTATGNVAGGNITTAGQVIATGNIDGGNLTTGGQVVSIGNITGGNLLSSGLLNVTGSLTGQGILTINGGGNPNAIVNGASNAVGNIGSSSKYFNSVYTDAFVGTTATLAGNVSATGNVSGGNVISSGLVSTSSITKTGSNAVGNIGSSTSYFNTVFASTFAGTSTTALYADLAERYTTDQYYEPGTVLSFGGSAELTLSSIDGDATVAGVVSTQPAYEMNSGLEGEFVTQLALVGRVPCRVQGPVWPGAMMVSAGNGRARAERTPAIGTVIGKALESFDGDQGTIEIVVGRL